MALPDNLGTLRLHKTPQKMTALWHDENGNIYKETLALPLEETKVWIRFWLFGQSEINPKGYESGY